LDPGDVTATVIYWLFINWKQSVEPALNSLYCVLVHCPGVLLILNKKHTLFSSATQLWQDTNTKNMATNWSQEQVHMIHRNEARTYCSVSFVALCSCCMTHAVTFSGFRLVWFLSLG